MEMQGSGFSSALPRFSSHFTSANSVREQFSLRHSLRGNNLSMKSFSLCLPPPLHGTSAIVSWFIFIWHANCWSLEIRGFAWSRRIKVIALLSAETMGANNYYRYFFVVVKTSLFCSPFPKPLFFLWQKAVWFDVHKQCFRIHHSQPQPSQPTIY